MVTSLCFSFLFSIHSTRHIVPTRHSSLGRMLKLRAVQWNAWLTHTRPNPPSIEVRFHFCRNTMHCCRHFLFFSWKHSWSNFIPQELQTDLARQHRVQMNVVMLEARDKEERERMALTQPSRWDASEPRWQEPEQARNEPPVNIRSDSAPAHVRDPWAEAKRGSDEPQPWTPVVRRK